MNLIKLFIASSAELDSDKTLFDVFFNSKNKDYRDRYVAFDHRTWKDFPSFMTETRLQDNYNKYIRDCDIVVFLFHTRMGQYTLEEFEIAHQQFIKSKGKKPRIYVYFKTGANTGDDPEIENFKQRNINLGHFYDTYTSNDELLAKFDRQLQLLENAGIIKPNPIDVKKIIKYGVLCFLLPLLVLFLGFYTFEYFTPFNMTVKVNEVYGIPSLPFTEGKITLTYEDKSETHSINDELVFKQISAKYKGKTARLVFSAQGYETIDSTISMKKMTELPIRRDHSLSLIFGAVKDEDNKPLKDVVISVLDIKTTTDETGAFRLNIPLEKQKEEQRLTAFKEGYRLWDFTAAPSQTVEWKIILEK
jgi:hypothetical protein